MGSGSNAGSDDIVISKLNLATSGSQVWTTQTGTSSVDQAYGICLDAGMENIFVTGIM